MEYKFYMQCFKYKIMRSCIITMSLILTCICMTVSTFGQAQIFDPTVYTQNATFQANFLSAIGETPDNCIDFESSALRNTPVGPAYKNLNNLAGVFPNGIKMSQTNNKLWVAQGRGKTWEDVDNNGNNDLGEAQAYEGQWALAGWEQESTTIDFTASPIDYFSCYIGDWDLVGKTETTKDCKVTITFVDNTTQVIATDRTASSQYEFWGYYTGPSGKKIKKVTFKCYNKDSEWALDKVCFGNKAGCNLAVTASNIGPFCSGNSISLKSTVSGANGTITYAWTGPGGFTSNVANPTRANSTTAMAGTYNLTVTNNGCSASSSTSVVVNQTPSPTAANAGPYCTGQTINLTSSGGGTYSWTGPANFTSTAQNPTRANAATTMGGVYTVTVTNNGCSASKTTTVVVNQTTARASSNSPVCKDSTLYLFSSGGGTYSWTGPLSFTSTLQNPSITAIQTTQAGKYKVTVTKNGCTAVDSVTVSVTNSCNTCNLKSSGLTTVECNNNGTVSNSSDDKITFVLNPTGIGLGATYSVSVSAGTITPASAAYNTNTTFTLNAGSAGGGDKIITITDSNTGACQYSFTLHDPGSCSNCPDPVCVPSSIIKN